MPKKGRRKTPYGRKTRRQLLGLLSPHPNVAFYYRCTVKELRLFVRQRGIRDSSKMRKKKDYIDALTMADKEPRFPLLNLPPELRYMIYELVLDDREPESDPMKQPIMGTSQLVREEAIATSLRLNVLTIGLHPLALHADEGRSGSGLLDTDSQVWFDNLGLFQFQYIRRLHVEFTARRARPGLSARGLQLTFRRYVSFDFHPRRVAAAVNFWYSHQSPYAHLELTHDIPVHLDYVSPEDLGILQTIQDDGKELVRTQGLTKEFILDTILAVVKAVQTVLENS